MIWQSMLARATPWTCISAPGVAHRGEVSCGTGVTPGTVRVINGVVTHY
jgi:hypothetical protein